MFSDNRRWREQAKIQHQFVGTSSVRIQRIGHDVKRITDLEHVHCQVGRRRFGVSQTYSHSIGHAVRYPTPEKGIIVQPKISSQV